MDPRLPAPAATGTTLATPRGMWTTSRLAIACLVVGTSCAPRVVKRPVEGPTGHREKAMLNCPSAVAGAQTMAKYTADGVALDVTSDDPEATRAILERARLHEHLGAPTGLAAPHSGQHGGPGLDGHCPIIHVGTTVSVAEIFGGARITVSATDAAAVPRLQHDIRERLAWLESVTRR